MKNIGGFTGAKNFLGGSKRKSVPDGTGPKRKAVPGKGLMGPMGKGLKGLMDKGPKRKK